MQPLMLEAGDERIQTALYPVRFAPLDLSLTIAVDDEEKDEITAALREGSYQVPSHYGLLLAQVGPSSRVVDLGSHIGTFALLAAARGAEVVAIEASPRNAALLRRSAEVNGFDNLRVVQVAAGDHEGVLEFIQAGPYGLAASPQFDSPRIQVPLRRVDDILHEVGWQRVDWMKMDIEGSEPAAIRGMPRLLTGEGAPTLLFESNGFTLALADATPMSLLAQLEAFGYHFYLVQQGTLHPVTTGDHLQGACNVDYLAVMGDVPRLPSGWQVAQPLTREETLAMLLATCDAASANDRAYAARTMSRLDPDLLERDTVRHALLKLTRDADPKVQAAAGWWSTPAAEDEEVMTLRLQLAERDAEIARLGALVRGYEKGRVMRAMLALSRRLKRSGR